VAVVTVQSIRDRVRWLADQQGAVLRHKDADLTQVIAQSYQRWRIRASENGFPDYLTPKQGTLSIGATSPYQFGVIDTSAWNPRPLAIYGLDIVVDGVHVALDAVDFRDRNSFEGNWTGANATPIAFSQYSDQQIVIFPPSDRAYQYIAWVLLVAADGAPFEGKAGWEEWIVWDVFVRILHRDKSAAVLASAQGELAKLEAEILKGTTRKQRHGPMVRRDTRRDRRLKRAIGFRTRFGGL
jgi:hypothetical protein